MKEDRVTPTVDQAFETLDHLLWEALISRMVNNFWDNAMMISQSYSRIGDSARVVYKQSGVKTRDSSSVFDPVKHHGDVVDWVGEMVKYDLPIKKLPSPGGLTWAIAHLCCSRPSYEMFLFQLQSPLDQWHIINGNGRYVEVDCELVEIGTKGLLRTHIVCPCNAQHLESSGELKNFNYEIEPPKKVGASSFEFRFSVSEKEV